MARSGTRPRLAALLLLALTAPAALSACSDAPGGGEPRSSYPAGAVTLGENRPRQVGGARMVAQRISADRATVTLLSGEGAPVDVAVTEGQTVDIGGTRYEVLDVAPGTPDDDRVDAPSGRVVIRPAP